MSDTLQYTWSDFKAAVNGLLPIDSTRLGPVQPLIGQWLRQTVIELQNYIPLFRQNHEVLYDPGDFVLEGSASRTTIPPQSRVKQAWLVTYDTWGNQGGLGPNLITPGQTYTTNPLVIAVFVGATYYWTRGLNDTNLVNGSQTLTGSGQFVAQNPAVSLYGVNLTSVTASLQLANQGSAVAQVDSIKNVTRSIIRATRHSLQDILWEDRMKLVDGRLPVNDGSGMICFDPQGETFYVYPGIKDGQQVSLFYDGLKTQFQDSEMTPFTEQMTLVVADFCEARLRRLVDKDLPLSASSQDSYENGRSLLYLWAKDQQRTNP